MSRRGTVEEPQAASDRDPDASGGALCIEVKRDLALSAEEGAVVGALIEGRPDVGAFVSAGWLSGFFAEPPPKFEPCLLIFRQGSAIRGILPVAVRFTIAHARVILLGGGMGSDRVDLIADRGVEAACADRFLAWLVESFGRRGFVLELRDVPAHSPLWGAVLRATELAPLVLQPREMHALPYLDLAELPSLCGGLAPKPLARTLERHRRWLDRRGRLRIDVLENAADVAAAFESLVQLLRTRWSGTAQGSALDRPRAQRFHQRALPLLLGAGRLRMIRVTSDLRTIAVYYGLACGRWRGCYLAGYDREWAGRIHLGKILFATAVELAADEGARVFDFLKGVEAVKYLWPVRERVTIDADVFSPHSGAQLARARHATRQVAAAVAKSLLSPVRGQR